MRRKKQRSGADKQAAQATAAAAARGFDHKPFRELARGQRKEQPAAAPIVAPPAPPKPQPVDDSNLFEREMTGVRPLSGTARSRVAPLPPAPPERAITDPDAEALAELSDLVAGDGPFDFANSVEFVEGAVAGLDRRLVRRLRSGDFAFQSHLDLHGMTAAEAIASVKRFIDNGRHRHRCGEHQLVAPPRLLESVNRSRWTSDHRLVAQIPSDICCQTIGRFVATSPVLLQTLHYDPIQISLELVD
jgi:DNA-nicking Smr family endonuclease